MEEEVFGLDQSSPAPGERIDQVPISEGFTADQ